MMTDCWSANGRKAIKRLNVAEGRREGEEGREVSRGREESKQSSKIGCRREEEGVDKKAA